MSWHECPECGSVCYCDMEDHHNVAASDECDHWQDEECAARRGECDENYEPDDYDDLYGEVAVARARAMEEDEPGPCPPTAERSTNDSPGPEGTP